MRRLFFFGCLVIGSLNAISQRTVDVSKESNAYSGAVNYMYTVSGVPFVNTKFARVVDGSPFFNEQMMRGAIILSEGKEYKNVLVRLNLLESQVNYIGEKQIEMITTTPVKEVVLWDTIRGKDHRFISSSYLETTEKPEKDFYELLQSGKAELYKQHKKQLQESKPYGSATVEQIIQTNIRFYVLLNKQWTKIKKIKELVSVFDDKKDEVLKFIDDKKLSGDTEANFEAITAYYNLLAQN
ncbi:MAG TPA: hypothetical protein VJ765_15635 [Chitinophagaceae bacterium]|nr:hypothetical protein [Chitinophagaceae bacterium]